MEKAYENTSNDEKYAIEIFKKEVEECEKKSRASNQYKPIFKNDYKNKSPIPKKNLIRSDQKKNQIKYSPKNIPEKIPQNIENCFQESNYISDTITTSTIFQIIQESEKLNNSCILNKKPLDMNKRIKHEGNPLKSDKSEAVIKVNQVMEKKAENEKIKQLSKEENIKIHQEPKKKIGNSVNCSFNNSAIVENKAPKKIYPPKSIQSKKTGYQVESSSMACLKILSNCPGQNKSPYIPKNNQFPHIAPAVSSINQSINSAIQNGENVPYEVLLELDRDAYDVGKGFSPKELKKIIVSKFKPSNQDYKCCICDCDLEVNQNYIILQCIHRYHEDCLKNWLGRKRSCPVCLIEVKLD